MTHITRVFNPENRTLTSVERRYAGQVGDSISTILHFEYTRADFLSEYTPYIMFDLKGDDGCPLVYGPGPEDPSEALEVALEDRIYFDGFEFPIPWAVTSRVKSARVDYQLFFIKVGTEFDGRNVAQLNSTEIMMSAIDSIALKPSITCDPCRSSSDSPPFVPTGTEPNLLGWVQLWKDYGLVAPVTQELIKPDSSEGSEDGQTPTEKSPVIRLTFHTYSGRNDTSVVLENVPVVIDGKLYYTQLPFGNTEKTYPLLRGTIEDGQSIMYSEDSNGFVAYDLQNIYRFRSTCTALELDTWEDAKAVGDRPLKNGDVYACTEDRSYGVDELGNANIFKAGTNWVWSEQERFEPLTGDMDLSKYQLESAKIDDWVALADDPEGISEKFYPTARLVKVSLDDKLDDSQLIHSWNEYDETKTGVNAQIPSVGLTKATLDDKLDDMQVIGTWEALNPSLMGQDIQIPSAVLVKTHLDKKLDDAKRVTKWNTPTDETIPSAKLVKDSLDNKLEDTRIVVGWDTISDETIPSSKLVKTDLDGKLDDTQLITKWNTPTDEQIPSAKLVKTDLDGKLDDAQLIRGWGADVADETIPSSKLVKDSLDRKTDITMAIPDWTQDVRFRKGATVIYSGTIFISLIGDNTSRPIDNSGDISPNWTKVQGEGGGGGSGAQAQSWTIGNKTDTSYSITHDFGTEDLFVSIREKTTGKIVDAAVTVLNSSEVRIDLSEPPEVDLDYVVSISPAVPSVPSTVTTIMKDFPTDSKEWRFEHGLNRALIVQTFNQDGIEIIGNVKQDFNRLDTVVVEFNQPVRGTMVVRR